MTTEAIAVPRELLERIAGKDGTDLSNDGYIARRELRALLATPQPTTIHTDNTETLRNALSAVTAERDRLVEHVTKAQQHALDMGNRALELAAFEVECHQLRAEVEALRGQLAEAQANDRTAMGYLAEVRAIVGGEDFPAMVRNVDALQKGAKEG